MSSVKRFALIALKLWLGPELIVQNCYPILDISCKIYTFEKPKIFFLSIIFNVSVNCSADYTNLPPSVSKPNMIFFPDHPDLDPKSLAAQHNHDLTTEF